MFYWPKSLQRCLYCRPLRLQCLLTAKGLLIRRRHDCQILAEFSLSCINMTSGSLNPWWHHVMWESCPPFIEGWQLLISIFEICCFMRPRHIATMYLTCTSLKFTAELILTIQYATCMLIKISISKDWISRFCQVYILVHAGFTLKQHLNSIILIVSVGFN